MINIPKLTQFSPGAGCGCKISPKDLAQILDSQISYADDPNLLVGNSNKDDAAVYDIGNGQVTISTTDFFTPIVDNPYNFGQIAAVNAISDIYAMGGKPIMAIAILGWPVDKLPLESAKQVLEGARAVCNQAGITLSGGHSIEISDPIFGLAVTGIAEKKYIKQNNKAKAGSKLFITKPLGIGIMATAEKEGLVTKEDSQEIIKLMTSLNKVGFDLAKFDSINAITDVTGFGLLGHLLEICEGSHVDAEINFEAVPTIKNLQKYIDAKTFPGGLFKNFKSYGDKVHELTEQQKYVLCDAQTSGGLLIAVEDSGLEKVTEFMAEINHPFYEVGILTESKGEKQRIKVK
ncbi:MAG: selenide, water dikinase SelD [Bacteroidota bacterium]|nr:selenide, water dikinase SelD [Bacteroidota bacterium]